MLFLLIDHPDFEPGKAYHTSKGHALEPRRVDFGEYAGRYVLRADVKNDSHHVSGLDILNGFQTVELEITDVFASEEDD